jgi:2-polyprenyl-3-methyl-5-hydroxy-6-metoxy-1,4-benzoquinol methylase
MTSFDAFSERYSEVNDEMLAGTGESTEALARYKADYLARTLPKRFEGKILDYGCGIGVVTRAIATRFARASVYGFDPSAASIAVASRDEGSGIHYETSLDSLDSNYDVIFVANVLHHVPIAERSALLEDLASRLNADGRLVVLEHNPRNWLVMRILARHPFDRDAVFLRHEESVALLESVKLKAHTDFIVFFPGMLKPLRFLEPALRWLPLGAQYVCVGEVTR